MTGGPVVRPAVADDLPAIREISGWAARETTANFHSDAEPLAAWLDFWRERGRYPWLVAERDGAVVAFAKGGRYKPRCAYRFTVETTIYVLPGAQSQGVASRLYPELLDRLEALGFHSAVAAITTPNPASERLHARCGFEHFGTLRRAGWKFGRWHDVSYWQRVFRPESHVPADA